MPGTATTVIFWDSRTGIWQPSLQLLVVVGTRAPQGFFSSGDCFNCRFDTILSGIPWKERCLADTIHHYEYLGSHWWWTIDLLHMMGAAGGVMNPEKIRICCLGSFTGFRITESTIELLPKYIEALRSFPTPKSTKDIRSWFRLVNQISKYA